MLNVHARVPLLASLIGLCGCAMGGGAKTPTQPATTAAATATGLRITGFTTSAAVVGSAVPLAAVVSLSDGTEISAPVGAVAWTTSNAAVASIDAQGNLVAQAPGGATISVSTKSATATLTISVVPNVAGTWTFDYVAESCDATVGSFTAGCRGPNDPWPHAAMPLIVTQVGDQLTARSNNVQFITGNVSMTGRISTSGAIDLSGSRCGGGDSSASYEISLTNWHMEPRADGTMNGRAEWWDKASSQFNDCVAPLTLRRHSTLLISNVSR